MPTFCNFSLRLVIAGLNGGCGERGGICLAQGEVDRDHGNGFRGAGLVLQAGNGCPEAAHIIQVDSRRDHLHLRQRKLLPLHTAQYHQL